MTITPKQARQIERISTRYKGAERTFRTPPRTHLLRDDVAMQIPSEINGGFVYLIVSASGHIREITREED